MYNKNGYYNVCRDSYTRKDLSRGLFFDIDWADTKKYVLVRLSTFEEFSAAELKSIFNLDHVEDFIR